MINPVNDDGITYLVDSQPIIGHSEVSMHTVSYMHSIQMALLS
jgi:hypothetical protein